MRRQIVRELKGNKNLQGLLQRRHLRHEGSLFPEDPSSAVELPRQHPSAPCLQV